MGKLSRLKGADRIRLRAGVMLGSDDIRGCQQTAFEIISNSIDRFKKGFGNKIIFIKHKDLSYTVEDFADGLPMDWNEDEQAFDWDLALKVLYAGENYDEENRQGGELGYNGLGLTSTQYSSEYMDVTVNRDGFIYEAHFKKGRPVDKDTRDFVCKDDDYILSKEFGERILKKYKNEYKSTGTKITYKPDSEVFTDINIPSAWIIEKFKKQAVVNEGLTIIYIDEYEGKTYEFKYNSIIDYLKELSNENTFSDFLLFEGKGRGQDIKSKPEYDVSFKFAFGFSNTFNRFEHYHNSSELTDRKSITFTSVEKALTETIHEYLIQNNLYSKGEAKIKFTDIEDSLICLLSSKSSYTSYANQTKLSIDNRFIKEFLTEQIKDKLKVYFIEHKLEADKIVNQILVNMRARSKAEETKAKEKKKNLNQLARKPVGKLADCTSNNPEECEIFLAEGDSAGGNAKQCRDRRTQAILPQRGKSENIEKSKKKGNNLSQDLKNIENSLGCGTGKNFNKKRLKYWKIILMADGDSDGRGHIVPLWLTYFYREMKQLIIDGHIYIALPPLYKNVLKIEKGEEILVHYTYTEDEQTEYLKTAKPVNIQRYKGLGEMDSNQLWDTTMNPETRKLIQVTIENDNEADETFKLLMGDVVKPRYEFIMSNAKFVKNIDI